MEAGVKKKREGHNQGYSLVELIVVITMVAIFSISAVYGIGMIGGWEMKKCVKQLDGAISETKMNAMSKGACELTITRDSDGNYDMQMVVGIGEKKHTLQKQRIADKRISIYYVAEDAATEYLITESNPLTISFDAGSGAYKPIKSTEVSGTYGKKLIVKMGTKHVTTIRLIKDTGRHKIE